MTYNLLPREPGDELTEIYPGFADRLMQRIEKIERWQKRRRAAAVVLTMACLVTGGYMLSTRQAESVQTVVQNPAVAKRQSSPVAMPAVKAEPVQQAAAPQNGVKPVLPVLQLASQAQPDAAPKEAGIRPGDVITIDGKEVHGALRAAILKKFADCRPVQIKLVRDGKPVSHTAPVSQEGNARCQ